MTKSNCKHWTELSERAETGGTLDESDERWARQHERSCPQCGAEARFWTALEHALEYPEALDLPLDGARLPGAKQTSPILHRLLRSPYTWFGAAACAAVTLAAVHRPSAVRDSTPAVAATFDVRLVEVHGEVRIGQHAAVAGARWTHRDQLRTGEGGRACVRLRDAILVCFDPHSDAHLDDQDPSHLGIKLDAGRVVSKLGPQPPTRPYTVRARALTATALGTEFVVTAEQKSDASVRLYEGRLELKAPNAGTRTIRAPSAASLDTALTSMPLTDEASRLDEPLRRLIRRRRDDSDSVLEVSTQPAGAEVSLDDEPLGPTPLSVLTGGGHRLTVSKPGYATVAEWLPPVFEPRRRRAYELAPASGGASSVAATETRASLPHEKTGQDPKALLARAQELRAQGKLRDSVAVLQQLVQNHPTSAEARVSLVSLGELELTQFGHPDRALSCFDGYLKAAGALTREARFGRIRALLALGRKEEADRDTRAFLDVYPNSIQAEQLRRRSSAR
jgi:tetratricopeptide (TPR) repeat protein